MKLDKKQVPQLIVLGILVVIFVGYLSFKVAAPGNQPQPKPATPATGDSAKTGAEEAAKPESGEDMTYVAQVFPTLGSVPARRDPFTPQKLPVGSVPNDQSQPQAVRQIRSVPVRSMSGMFKNPMGKVPPLTLQPIPQFSPGNTSVAPSLPPVREDKGEDTFTVSGVVRGESNVAIIRSASGRHVVREGQMIDGRYKVLSVTGDGAVLAYGNRHIPVKLGGDKNAQ